MERPNPTAGKSKNSPGAYKAGYYGGGINVAIKFVTIVMQHITFC